MNKHIGNLAGKIDSGVSNGLIVLTPFVDGFSSAVGHQLTLYTADDVDGGLGSQDQRLDDVGRNLTQNSAHRPRHPLLLGFFVGHSH